MMDRYNQREGGLEIIELDDAFQLCTRREYYDALIRVAKQPKKYVLTDVQLEVLSIFSTLTAFPMANSTASMVASNFSSSTPVPRLSCL